MKKKPTPLIEQIRKTEYWQEFQTKQHTGSEMPLHEFFAHIVEIRFELLVFKNTVNHKIVRRFETYVSNLVQITSEKQHTYTVESLAGLKYPKKYLGFYPGIQSDHDTLLSILEEILKDRDANIFKWHPNKKVV
jgi:hypothetical protein